MSKQVVASAPPVSESFGKKYGLIIGLLVMLGIMLLPAQPGLPVAGQRMLAILVFSVIVWMTDTISYPVSAGVIMALMAITNLTAILLLSPVVTLIARDYLRQRKLGVPPVFDPARYPDVKAQLAPGTWDDLPRQ